MGLFGRLSAPHAFVPNAANLQPTVIDAPDAESMPGEAFPQFPSALATA
jgi:hypothetical protein